MARSVEVAHDLIRKRIVDGGYHPGQRLIESHLADELGFGRHIIRGALERLQASGLVRIEANRGASVASITLADVLEILEAREALEVAATRLAATKIKPKEVKELSRLIEEMAGALETERFARYSEVNKVFHAKIYRAGGNSSIVDLIEVLKARLARLDLRTLLVPGRSVISLAEHRAILAALEDGDPMAAEIAVRAHMRGVASAVERAWSIIAA